MATHTSFAMIFVVVVVVGFLCVCVCVRVTIVIIYLFLSFLNLFIRDVKDTLGDVKLKPWERVQNAGKSA